MEEDMWGESICKFKYSAEWIINCLGSWQGIAPTD